MMLRRRHALYLVIGLTLFFMSSGFLGMCVGTDYKPATIKITSPAKGMVFEAGTPAIIITGKVTAGDSEIQTLKAQGKVIAFNKTTGLFSYELKMNQAEIFTTCEFTVIDKKGIANIERASYSLGQASEPGAVGVIDNAMRLVLTDSLLDQVEKFASNFMNTWKNDLIYGWDNATYGSLNPESPFASMSPIIPTARIPFDDGMNGWIQLSQAYSEPQDKGYINLGKISISTDILPTNQIAAGILITPESWVNPRGGSAKALFVQGHYRTYPLGIETRIHFTVYTNLVNVSNVKLGLGVNSNNKIVAKLDLSRANIDLGNPTIEFGKIELEDELINFILDIVKNTVLKKLAIEMELVGVNDISFDLLGLNISGWPMMSTIFTTPTADQMVIDLGLSAKLAEDTIPLVQDLTVFYTTLPNTQPAITMTSNENIAMAISDDLMNEASFDLIQLGLLKNLDLTSSVKDLLGKLVSGKTIIAKATLLTPPIFDFSGTEVLPDGITQVGRVIVKDLYFELYYKGTVLPYPYAARMCVDVDLDLQLKLSEDGKHVQALLNVPNSSFTINYLYTNLTNSALLPEIGGKLTVKVLDMLLQKLVNFDIPTIDLFGQSIAIGISDTELINNCLVAKLDVVVQ
jgi:hypothetical protein